MELTDYKSNSNKSKELEKKNQNERKIEKVVTGKVITKKKGLFQKVTDEFISEDVTNIKSYILGDVLIPAIKKAISDIVTNGIEMMLYGSTGRRNNNSYGGTVSYRNYASYNTGTSVTRRNDNYNFNSYSYDDIILNTRGEAEEVLARMDELINTYGLVTVADLYDLVGISGNYTDNKYGWQNIRNASVQRVRDGYMIKMPRAIPIE